MQDAGAHAFRVRVVASARVRETSGDKGGVWIERAVQQRRMHATHTTLKERENSRERTAIAVLTSADGREGIS